MIAGQTAGSRGITLRCSFPLAEVNNGRAECLRLIDSKHIIMRYMRFRGTYVDNETPGRNLIDLTRCESILFDHLSVAFASNNAIDIYQTHNFTLQNSILTEVCVILLNFDFLIIFFFFRIDRQFLYYILY